MAYTLDYYKRLYNNLKRQIDERNTKNRNIQNEINRLQDAYNKLANIKRNVMNFHQITCIKIRVVLY